MSKTEFKQFLKDQYKGKQVSEIKELVAEKNLGLLPLAQVFTINEGVTQKQEVGYYAGVEKITQKDEGCGTQGQSIAPQVRKKIWEPEKFKGHLKFCYSDLYNTFLQWKMKHGISRQNLEGTDYINFLIDLIQDGIYKDFTRYAFFGDKTHSVVNSGSGTQVLTQGENAINFNIINGLFAQVEKELTTNTEKRYTIEANSKNTYAEQRILTGEKAFEAFNFLIDNAPAETFADGASPLILATYSMVRPLSQFLRNEYKNELTLKAVEGGYLVGEFEGVKVVTHRWLDQVIRRDFNNGTKWNNPHRALLIDQRNEQIGIDSLNSLQDIEVEYVGGDDEHTHIKFGYMADFQRANDTLVAGAY